MEKINAFFSVDVIFNIVLIAFGHLKKFDFDTILMIIIIIPI